LRLSTWNQLLAGGNFGAVVFPNNAEYSPLLWHVNHLGPAFGFATEDLMPYLDLGNDEYALDSTALITAEDYQILYNWVQQGMPNANGQVAWAQRQTESRDKWFFLNSSTDQVAVLDPTTNLIMTYFRIGQNPAVLESPHYIALSPDGQYLYVTLILGNLIEKYHTDNYQLVARSPFLNASQIAHVEASADGRWLIATNWVDATGGNTDPKILVLDANSLQVVSSVTDGFLNRIHGAAVNAAFTTAYITSNAGNYFLKVDLNPTNGSITGLTPYTLDGLAPQSTGGQAPYQCILSPDETRLFITSPTVNAVFMYDVSGPVPVQLAFTGSDGAECAQGVGKNPKLLVYHEGRLYIACHDQLCTSSANRNRKGCVSVVRVEANTLVWERNIYGLGEQSWGLSIDAQRKRLYVSNAAQTESAHHPIPGQNYNPGNYNWVDITNPQNPVVQWATPRDAAGFPTGAVFLP
jgi:DNA-binding beta-propeller fold protein YncE